ncbi:MAG: hypothetical protein AB7F88_00080 [Pyrinomonadaceae bacterium]
MRGLSFSYHGDYRVQSKKSYRFSTLEGVFLSGPNLLNNDSVNKALRASNLYDGESSINLRGAEITVRTGMFDSEFDILYKRDFFIPGYSSASFAADLVDVAKSLRLWNDRLPFLNCIFDEETIHNAKSILDDLTNVITNEYFCHEAGHFLGCNILTKYRSGYFKVQQRTIWPLIYVEEFRADIQGTEVVKNLLPIAEFSQLILYNLFLRFGVAAYGVRVRREAYGNIPFLLFRLLHKIDFLTITSGPSGDRLRIPKLGSADIENAAAECLEHVTKRLTKYEVENKSDIEKIGINSLQYYREQVADERAVTSYKRIFCLKD